MLLCALSVFSVVLMGSTLQRGEHRMWQSVPSHEQCCVNVQHDGSQKEGVLHQSKLEEHTSHKE